MRRAHAASSAAAAGWHTNTRRRAGVSPGPVAENGPSIVTDPRYVMVSVIEPVRSYTRGLMNRFRCPSVIEALVCRKPTATSRGPALIGSFTLNAIVPATRSLERGVCGVIFSSATRSPSTAISSCSFSPGGPPASSILNS